MSIGHSHSLCCIICCIFWDHRKLPGAPWNELKRIAKNNPCFDLPCPSSDVFCSLCQVTHWPGPKVSIKTNDSCLCENTIVLPGMSVFPGKYGNRSLSYSAKVNPHTDFKAVQLDTNILFVPKIGGDKLKVCNSTVKNFSQCLTGMGAG